MKLSLLAGLAFLSALPIVGSLRAAPPQSLQKAARPSILFILTDDQRWNAPGCLGDQNIARTFYPPTLRGSTELSAQWEKYYNDLK